MATPIWHFTLESLVADIPYLGLRINWGAPIPAILTFGSALLYILLVTVVFPAMKPSTAKEVASFSRTHHGLLFVYSTVCFLATLGYLFYAGELQSWQGMLCTPLPSWLRVLSITFTVSKIWEWFDTAVHIWNGKALRDIDFLHLYHHATTFFLFLHVMNLPGTEKSGMLLNGFVHSLMYYHFAYRLPKFMRPIITFAQIIQLATVTYMWSVIPDQCPAFASFPSEHRYEFLVPYLMVPVYLLFFIKFFFDQYVCKKPVADKNKKAINTTATSSLSASAGKVQSSSGSVKTKSTKAE